MSSLPWFRVYHRMIDDERLRLLAFEDRWHFVALLCLKADGMIDGEKNELWERRLAVKMGLQTRELEELQRRLMGVGLIDADWQPCKWDELQQRSDHSRERVRAHRERKKSSDNKACNNVTVTVTEVQRPRVDKIREDKIEPKGSCASDDARAFTVHDFVESWNEVAQACGLSQIRKLTDARKRAFAVRRREYPDIEDWQAAFRCLQANRWMHGDSKTGWRADPDFFLQAKSFTKLAEGQYGQADR